MQTKSTLIVLIAVLSSLLAHSQLSGTYTIGATGANYSTFTAAKNALAAGITGPVVFNVQPGVYNEKVLIGTVGGVSATNTITFQSANGDSTSVILSDSSTISTSNNYTLKLNQTSRIIFKKISIRKTGVADNATVVEIGGSSNNISFISCRFEGLVSSTPDLARTVVMANVPYTNTSISFDKCVFMNGSYGLYLQGQGSTSGLLQTGNSITGNHFTNQYLNAIRLAYQDAPVFNANVINSNSSYYNYQGLYAFYCTNGTQVLRNKFAVSAGRALYIHNSNGSSTNRGLIANNFISHGGSGFAIVLENSHSQNIYYNSINAWNSSGDVRLLQISGLSTSLLYIANNSFYSIGSGYVYYIDPNTNVPVTMCDYNNVKNNGANFSFFKSTGNISSLSSWQTTTTFDANSISVHPSYLSNIDLHVSTDSLDKKATIGLMPPLVPQDIDGETRSTNKPDIGAHERWLDDLRPYHVYSGGISLCVGQTFSLSFGVINVSSYVFKGEITVGYSVGGTISHSQTYYNQVVAPGDSLFFNLNFTDTMFTAGNFPISMWCSSPDDRNLANDSTYLNVVVYSYPIVNLGSDTVLCGHIPLTLDAGIHTSYLWSTGATNNQIIADTITLGYGQHWVWVKVENHGCFSTDSISITFVNCTSVEELNSDIFTAYVAPNPVNEESMLYIKGLVAGRLNIEVMDVAGRSLKKDHVNDDVVPLRLSELVSGTYFIRLQQDDKTQILRIVIP